MIYTTGDTHGNQGKWIERIHPVLASGDVLIINGDFGVGFWDGKYWPEEFFYDWISEQEYTVLFVDGNHEDFNKLSSYPVESWNGGRVHKIRHNLIHLMRGEIYYIDDITVLAFGGGYSMDKKYRPENISWWPQEMPSESEYRNAKKNLEKVDFKVDYIITHTTPLESIQYLSAAANQKIKEAMEEHPLNAFLDEVQRRTTYKHWYFGHLHIDTAVWRNQTAVFDAIRELKTGKIIPRWEPDYTKLTISEAEALKEAEQSGFVDEEDIDWSKVGI